MSWGEFSIQPMGRITEEFEGFIWLGVKRNWIEKRKKFISLETRYKKRNNEWNKKSPNDFKVLKGNGCWKLEKDWS